ncbi:hypothetical protein RintRC_2654 [Richelia intracellularis]|nr:hypothetical protein RintRC_2654 [Richelia intracellularis]
MIIASLSCLLQAIGKLRQQQSLSGWTTLFLVAINTLQVDTHYFFVISLAAQGLVCLWLIWQHWRGSKSMPTNQPYWQRIWFVALGTLAGCLVWFPILPTIYGSEPTTWVKANHSVAEPVERLLL